MVTAIVVHASALPHAVVIKEPLLKEGGSVVQGGAPIPTEMKMKPVEVQEGELGAIREKDVGNRRTFFPSVLVIPRLNPGVPFGSKMT